jgi:hypothetical protein
MDVIFETKERTRDCAQEWLRSPRSMREPSGSPGRIRSSDQPLTAGTQRHKISGFLGQYLRREKWATETTARNMRINSGRCPRGAKPAP